MLLDLPDRRVKYVRTNNKSTPHELQFFVLRMKRLSALSLLLTRYCVFNNAGSTNRLLYQSRYYTIIRYHHVLVRSVYRQIFYLFPETLTSFPKAITSFFPPRIRLDYNVGFIYTPEYTGSLKRFVSVL